MVSLRTLALACLLLLLGVLTALLRHLEKLTQDSLHQASELVLLQTSNHVEDAVRDFLSPAQNALEDLKRHLRLGTLDSFEPSFYQTLHANPRLSELTFTTYTTQLSVYREADGDIVTRFVNRQHQAEQRVRKPEQPFREEKWTSLGPVPDPSEHPTFQTPRRFFLDGDASPLWSDLSYSQLDPVPPKRIGVTVQAALSDSEGYFRGVARIGLVTNQLSHAFDDLNTELRGTPYRAFLCDSRGRLITSVLPTQNPDPIQEDDDDLRVIPKYLDPTIRAILARIPSQNNLLHEGDYLACVRPLRLENTQDWWVGIVVPENSLVGNLPELRSQLLLSTLIAAAIITVTIAALLYLLRHELCRLSSTARKMKEFRFEPQPVKNAIQEISQVALSLEAAKTTLRAMVKYVPVELVHQLFEARLEPVLGSQPRTVTLMFTDIAGFTTMAEKLTPDRLSEALGNYLTCMNQLIHENQGSVLERVGDALLSLWNAPKDTPDGEKLACRTALLCQKAILSLPDAELLTTRFGIHRDTVLVGHFGSPDRLNYGVLGDGVNLAARLEGLNKQYGTHIIVSQSVKEHLGEEFHVRRLDRVAVKGKSQPIEIYELLEKPGEKPQNYEKAWDLYARRQFSSALEILEKQPDDPPSLKLAARCRVYLNDPPPEGWDGTYLAKDK